MQFLSWDSLPGHEAGEILRAVLEAIEKLAVLLAEFGHLRRDVAATRVASTTISTCSSLAALSTATATSLALRFADAANASAIALTCASLTLCAEPCAMKPEVTTW